MENDVLSCFICMGTLQDARFCLNCSKLCCFECINKWQNVGRAECPHCQAPIPITGFIKCRWVSDVVEAVNVMSKELDEMRSQIDILTTENSILQMDKKSLENEMKFLTESIKEVDEQQEFMCIEREIFEEEKKKLKDEMERTIQESELLAVEKAIIKQEKEKVLEELEKTVQERELIAVERDILKQKREKNMVNDTNGIQNNSVLSAEKLKKMELREKVEIVEDDRSIIGCTSALVNERCNVVDYVNMIQKNTFRLANLIMQLQHKTVDNIEKEELDSYDQEIDQFNRIESKMKQWAKELKEKATNEM